MAVDMTRGQAACGRLLAASSLWFFWRIGHVPPRVASARANRGKSMSISPTAKRQIVGIHVKDIEWIIALWFAIHGGDPAPEHLSPAQAATAANGLIRAAAVHLDPAMARAVTAALGQ
jgi:hypothetical protein